MGPGGQAPVGKWSGQWHIRQCPHFQDCIVFHSGDLPCLYFVGKCSKVVKVCIVFGSCMGITPQSVYFATQTSHYALAIVAISGMTPAAVVSFARSRYMLHSSLAVGCTVVTAVSLGGGD